MDKIIPSAGLGAELEGQLQVVVDALSRVYHRQLVSILLYGSAARGDFISGRSDVNLLVVLQSVRLEDLAEAAKQLRRWRKFKITPLFLTEGELRLAARAFPLEVSDIQESGYLLFGSNPLSTIVVSPEDVRAQSRRELHGSLIRLRQGYLELLDHREALGGLLAGAITSLLPVFRAIIRLDGTPVPSTDMEVVESVASRHHLDRDLLTRLLAHKRGSIRLATADVRQILSRLVEEWERVIVLVDAA
ncbi:nucleotidyltransferase domain-containing protein [Candidatus Methylomirabilis sp.]|uniref:nucleotidyltransferase domain-containing protein n=1 Tax=Candidatus Methylomirabilis sp. TaxID=2032687 RepID=UPI002A6143C6|nr:nucleotidyltransferase domain-containing protein [Candidatus Methylomirabilis sp.]